MGCTSSKQAEEDKFKDFKAHQEAALHLFTDCKEWSLRGELSHEADKSFSRRAASIVRDTMRTGSQLFRAATGSTASIESSKSGTETQADSNVGERGPLYTRYEHSHTDFKVIVGKGFLDFKRRNTKGELITGQIRISFEGNFIQFTWLRDKEFADMRGYLYDGAEAEEAFCFAANEEVPKPEDMVIRGTFTSRDGTTGKFDIFRTSQKIKELSTPVRHTKEEHVGIEMTETTKS